MGLGTARASRHLRLTTPVSEMSDGDLVSATRSGDRSAYAELWQRHCRAAIAVARSYTSFDADDVVAEAYANIYTAISAGGGPTIGFRPYLFTTVRNVAAQWGRAANSLNVDDIESIGDISHESDTLDLWEKSLTATAFRSLPDAWQEVLWYSEVEAMTPRQISPLIGLSPNSVSALTMRAREGLRAAWITAHLSSTTTSPECTWTLGKLAAWSRGRVSVRIRTRVDTHLVECAHCRAAADEASNINSSLALVLLPLTIGVAGAAAYLRSVGSSSAPPPVAVATSVGASAAGVGAGVAVVGGLVAAAVVAAVCLTVPGTSGSSFAGAEQTEVSRSAQTASAAATPPVGQSPSEPAVSAPLTSTQTSDTGASPDAPAAVPAAGSQTENGAIATSQTQTQTHDDAPPAIAAPSMQSAQRPTIVYPAVHGSAEADAVVGVAIEGLVHDWTVVADASGNWAVELTGLTPGV